MCNTDVSERRFADGDNEFWRKSAT
jgi:hypothetical protein